MCLEIERRQLSSVKYDTAVLIRLKHKEGEAMTMKKHASVLL